jgi:hypothetical protein
VALRADHPSWGPRKLKARLQMIDPQTQWPVASTIGELLHRHGLTVPRRRRVVTPADILPFANCAGPNDTWCIDFKGWFRTRDGRRCDPLTISDAYSRCCAARRCGVPIRVACVPCWKRVSVNTGCRCRYAATTDRRLPPAAWPVCRDSRSGSSSSASSQSELPRGGDQCDISVGTVMDCSMPRVTPPRTRSCRRE